MQQQRYTTKSLTASADKVVLDVQGLSSLAINLTGTFVGTVQFEYTVNGTDWYALSCTNTSSSATETSATAVGNWTATVSGYQAIRVRCSAFTSGSIGVSTRAVLSGGSSSSGGGSATDGETAPTDPTLVAGVYNATPPTYADGDAANLQSNSVGALMSGSLDSFYITKASPAAFDGGTTNARGDDAGTSDPLTLFTVTGDVLLGVYGVCTTDLVGDTATLSVGPTGNTALLIPSTTATTIDAGELWMDASPAIGKPIDSLTYYLIGNGIDIVESVGIADITAGQMYYICLWKPLSTGSSVVAAT